MLIITIVRFMINTMYPPTVYNNKIEINNKTLKIKT